MRQGGTVEGPETLNFKARTDGIQERKKERRTTRRSK